jgi:leucyl aminopeptidase (aminopeptidase T)
LATALLKLLAGRAGRVTLEAGRLDKRIPLPVRSSIRSKRICRKGRIKEKLMGEKEDLSMAGKDLSKAINLIVRGCVAVKPGENVLIIADTDENAGIAALLAAEARSIGANVAVTLVDPARKLHHEPPKFVAESMKHADIIIGVIYSFLHTKARIDAQAAGARIAILGGEKIGQGRKYLEGIDLDMEDLQLIEKRSVRLAEIITQGKTATITSEKGTNLTMSLENRKGLPVIPVCRGSSVFCLLGDYSEVACPPVEYSAEGTLVIDGAMTGLETLERVVKEPMTLTIRKGRIVDISGGKDARDLEAVLSKADPNGKALAELGIGMTHKVLELQGVIRDKANLGTLHVAFGKNEFIGGVLKSEVHIDLMVTKPSLQVDQLLVMERGELRL